MENSSSYNKPGDRVTTAYTTQHTTTPVATAGVFSSWKRISWSAVFAGVLVATVTQLVLTLLGIGLGLSTIDPVQERDPTQGLGIGAGIWYIVSSLISTFVGGWVAGRLSSAPRAFDAILHGILTWSLMTLLTFYLLTTALGKVIGGASSLVSGVLGAAGTGIAAAGPGLADAAQDQLKKQGIDIDMTDLRGEVEQLLRDTGKPGLQPKALERQANRAQAQAGNAAERAAANPQGADETADGVINNFIKRGEGVADQIDREAAINVVMKRSNKNRAETGQIVDNWIKTYNQSRLKFEKAKRDAEVTARHAADDAAKGASTAAILASLGLILGAVVAGLGGRTGAKSKYGNHEHDEQVSA